jgi:hypothetical protein
MIYSGSKIGYVINYQELESLCSSPVFVLPGKSLDQTFAPSIKFVKSINKLAPCGGVAEVLHSFNGKEHISLFYNPRELRA